MVNLNDEDVYTATVGTETVITNKTVNKHFQFEIDCRNLQSGESIELRLYKKNASGGTLMVYDLATVTFPTTDKEGWRFNWEPSIYEYQVTGKQIGGTARNFNWILYDA
jgi:hypothetical protein